MCSKFICNWEGFYGRGISNKLLLGNHLTDSLLLVFNVYNSALNIV